MALTVGVRGGALLGFSKGIRSHADRWPNRFPLVLKLRKPFGTNEMRKTLEIKLEVEEFSRLFLTRRGLL